MNTHSGNDLGDQTVAFIGWMGVIAILIVIAAIAIVVIPRLAG